MVTLSKDRQMTEGTWKKTIVTIATAETKIEQDIYLIVNTEHTT